MGVWFLGGRLDKDIDAINYAKSKYRNRGIEFIQTDIFSFVPLIVFDTIISLETMEHLLETSEFHQSIFFIS